MILSEKDFLEGISVLSSTDFDILLKEFAQCLNIQISQDVSYVLQFCGFYLKSWETLDKDHTKTLNVNLPKERISDTRVRQKPIIAETHKEINRLQKTIEDESLIHSEDDDLPSVTQLGRILTQWKYKIKSRVASYQKKHNQKIVLTNYKEAEKHLELNTLNKRQLCSLLHNFYDPSYTLIP